MSNDNKTTSSPNIRITLTPELMIKKTFIHKNIILKNYRLVLLTSKHSYSSRSLLISTNATSEVKNVTYPTNATIL